MEGRDCHLNSHNRPRCSAAAFDITMGVFLGVTLFLHFRTWKRKSGRMNDMHCMVQAWPFTTTLSGHGKRVTVSNRLLTCLLCRFNQSFYFTSTQMGHQLLTVSLWSVTPKIAKPLIRKDRRGGHQFDGRMRERCIDVHACQWLFPVWMGRSCPRHAHYPWPTATNPRLSCATLPSLDNEASSMFKRRSKSRICLVISHLIDVCLMCRFVRVDIWQGTSINDVPIFFRYFDHLPIGLYSANSLYQVFEVSGDA